MKYTNNLEESKIGIKRLGLVYGDQVIERGEANKFISVKEQ